MRWEYPDPPVLILKKVSFLFAEHILPFYSRTLIANSTIFTLARPARRHLHPRQSQLVILQLFHPSAAD